MFSKLRKIVAGILFETTKYIQIWLKSVQNLVREIEYEYHEPFKKSIWKHAQFISAHLTQFNKCQRWWILCFSQNNNWNSFHSLLHSQYHELTGTHKPLCTIGQTLFSKNRCTSFFSYLFFYFFFSFSSSSSTKKFFSQTHILHTTFIITRSVLRYACHRFWCGLSFLFFYLAEVNNLCDK